MTILVKNGRNNGGEREFSESCLQEEEAFSRPLYSRPKSLPVQQYNRQRLLQITAGYNYQPAVRHHYRLVTLSGTEVTLLCRLGYGHNYFGVRLRLNRQ